MGALTNTIIPCQYFFFSQEGNAEIYNEAFINQALKIKASSLPLAGKPDWECRLYLHRKSVSRGLRLYLLERKMRSLNLNWTFPVYSAYDDSAYSEHMSMLDEIRIKVFEKDFLIKYLFL